ncbi:MAG TPA: M20/M25/M40 family metallo-hydrolase [Kofleriaceae bacterium]|nr:M20/M25/M40 family metallo-hydrolase [Kofleriaceae bacterium]
MNHARSSGPSLVAREAQEICQQLLRIDTTNPPGNERPAAELLARLLEEVGYEPVLLEAAPGRANLVCRRPGTGAAAPLLLSAHLDVVESRAEKWRHPPFSGAAADGCLWGRGAIDMKHMAAMCTAVLRQLARERRTLTRDVIFAAVADEEAGCDLGSRFLVEQHPELVRAEFAIGEVGGYSLHIGKTTFYPIQVAEKGLCWVRASVRGEPGHGSMPRDDNAVLVLAERIARLRGQPFAPQVNEYVRDFIERVAAAQPRLLRPLLKVLAQPRLLPSVLRRLPDSGTRRGFAALLSNTASPTVLRAGEKINVIPDRAEVLLDGRTLPGQTAEDFVRELRGVLGDDVEIEVMKFVPAVVTEPAESPLYDAMRDAIVRREPEAVVVPYMLPGFTDAKYFSRLGARWYGFAPVKIERGSGISFSDMFHGHDERIPVAGLHWGAEVLADVVTRFCGES